MREGDRGRGNESLNERTQIVSSQSLIVQFFLPPKLSFHIEGRSAVNSSSHVNFVLQLLSGF